MYIFYQANCYFDQICKEIRLFQKWMQSEDGFCQSCSFTSTLLDEIIRKKILKLVHGTKIDMENTIP